jgi:hypothetical protein
MLLRLGSGLEIEIQIRRRIRARPPGVDPNAREEDILPYGLTLTEIRHWGNPVKPWHK